MSTILNTEETYRIETKTSAGKVTCEITGNEYEIDGHENKRGGVIEVSNPHSAKALVDSSSRRSFVNKTPSPEAVEAAQKERLGFDAGSEVIESFAMDQSGAVGSMDLGAENGFDPVDGPTNDPKLRVVKMFRALKPAGYQDEASYLRQLPSIEKQEAFVTHLRESEEVDL